MESYCEIADCERPAFRGGLCALHLKRRQRGLDLSAPLAERMSPEERVIAAGNAWLESGDDDDEYEARRRAFLRACESWMRSRGWRPPPRKTRTPTRARRRVVQMDMPITSPRAE